MAFFNLREGLPGLEVMVPWVEGGLTSPRVVPGSAPQDRHLWNRSIKQILPFSKTTRRFPRTECEKHSSREQKKNQLGLEAGLQRSAL